MSGAAQVKFKRPDGDTSARVELRFAAKKWLFFWKASLTITHSASYLKPFFEDSPESEIPLSQQSKYHNKLRMHKLNA